MHVGLVLRERDRRHADVMAALEKEGCPDSSRIADPVAIRRAADHTATDDRNLLLDLEQIERRLNDVKLEPETSAQFGSGQLACEMQRLQHELQDQVERDAGLLDALRA